MRSQRHPVRIETALLSSVAASALLIGACVPREEPISQVKLEDVERSESRGFVWTHRRPQKPLPGARYEAGFDTKARFGLGVCRVAHEGAVYPGKIYGQRCSSPIDGKEVVSEEFDVLIAAPKALWHIPADAKVEPATQLIGGRNKDGSPLPVCVARFVEGLSVFATHHGYQPGSFRDDRCYFGWNGDEHSSKDYFLLGIGTPLPKQPTKLNRPLTCSAVEKPCPCGKLSGCTQPGYCPCEEEIVDEPEKKKD